MERTYTQSDIRRILVDSVREDDGECYCGGNVSGSCSCEARFATRQSVLEELAERFGVELSIRD